MKQLRRPDPFYLKQIRLYTFLVAYLFSIPLSAQNTTAKDPAAEIMEKMSREEKVGQLFIFGFPGIDAYNGLFHDKRLKIPGGIVLFSNNIKSVSQLSTLTFKAQKYSMSKLSMPVFIALDQEGGRVIRIRTKPPLPSALALGQTKNTELATEVGRYTGELLRAFGINMNLAPVMDVSDPEVSSFIGTRSFGNDPKLIGSMASAFIEGVSSQNIYSILKHFPGHGDVTVDSHQSLPVKFSDHDELMQKDLVPYKLALKENLPTGIMVAHMALPKLDPSGVPATFSPIIINQILRKELNYQGLVITDDIEMLGSSKVGTIEERAIKALEAGVDLVMVAWNRKSQVAAYQGVLKALTMGRLSEARVNESVRRIVLAKLRIQSSMLREPHSPNTIAKFLQSPRLKKLMNDISAQHIADAGLDSRLKDFNFSNNSKIMVVSDSVPFKLEFKKAWQQTYTYSPSADTTQINRAFKKIKGDKIAVFHVTGSKQAQQLEELTDDVASQTLVVNGDLPGLIKRPSRYLAVVNLFTRASFHGRAIVQALIHFTQDRIPAQEK